MLGRRFLVPALLPIFVACASASGDAHDDARIVPEGLTVTALAGGNGVLQLTALTLRSGPRSTELYVALRNEGDRPACSAAVSVELFDKDERSLAAGIGGLLTPHFYRLTDGSGAIAACVGPGDVTMAAVTDLPSELVIEEVETIVYRCPYFALDVVPIAGVTVSATGGGRETYRGTLVNGLDVALENPSVTVFSVDRGGRPLGMTIVRSSVEVSPAGSWKFETNIEVTPGVDYVAYPAGALGH
jgi:hypothetical protein